MDMLGMDQQRTENEEWRIVDGDGDGDDEVLLLVDGRLPVM